jgi:hypothetical protein
MHKIFQLKGQTRNERLLAITVRNSHIERYGDKKYVRNSGFGTIGHTCRNRDGSNTNLGLSNAVGR